MAFKMYIGQQQNVFFLSFYDTSNTRDVRLFCVRAEEQEDITSIGMSS